MRSFREHGLELVPAAVAPHLDDLKTALAGLPHEAAGSRISGLAGLRPFLEPNGPIGAIACAAMGTAGRAVRAILFDKTATTNWSLPWHQDRTICVRRRIEVDGYGPWSTKSGMQHVAPPFELLSRMVTLRAHIDDVPADNAPLLAAPGSHRYGRVPAESIDDVVRRCGVAVCLASAGDVWLYATPILHASEAALAPRRRRVLQVDFSSDELPGGLEWLGV